jgi:hypothetical protein
MRSGLLEDAFPFFREGQACAEMRGDDYAME